MCHPLLQRAADLEDLHDALGAVRPVADELPGAVAVGVTHLDALDHHPMTLLAHVQGQDVVDPGVARTLHPTAPQAGALLTRKTHVALLELHAVAEVRERGRYLLGIGALDDGRLIGWDVAEGAHLRLDLAHREARDGADHDGAAERHPAGVVVGLVEARRKACGRLLERGGHARGPGVGWALMSLKGICAREA